MSDECLMKGESGISYFGGYQAVMRKFTLAMESQTSGREPLEKATFLLTFGSKSDQRSSEQETAYR